MYVHVATIIPHHSEPSLPSQPLFILPPSQGNSYYMPPLWTLPLSQGSRYSSLTTNNSPTFTTTNSYNSLSHTPVHCHNYALCIWKLRIIWPCIVSLWQHRAGRSWACRASTKPCAPHCFRYTMYICCKGPKEESKSSSPGIQWQRELSDWTRTFLSSTECKGRFLRNHHRAHD